MTEDTTASPTTTPKASTGVSGWWRALSIFLSLVVFIGWALTASMYEQFKAQIHHLEAKLVEIPQVRDVSVLLDEAQASAILMTYDPKNQKLQVQRLNDVKEGREQALHVWAIAEDDTPRMLGVLTNKYKTQQLDVPTQALEGARSLAISVENKDRGPYKGKPQQPWLFKGWLVQKAI
jgi:anti-sigma-K factor RskA